MKRIIYIAVLSPFIIPSITQADEVCTQYGDSVTLPSELDEISGMAVSRTNSRYIWTHVDSGGKPYLYLIEPVGNIVHVFEVQNTNNIDWEDIAVGPCSQTDTKSCIYIGDTGDNTFSRNNKSIIIVEEPKLANNLTRNTTPEPLTIREKLPFIFPSTDSTEPKFINPDCESLRVDPITAEIYIVSKQSSGGAQSLYRIPRSQTNAPLYAEIYGFALKQFPNIAEAFQHPTGLFLTREIQGESVAYAANPDHVITSSEKKVVDAILYELIVQIMGKTRVLGKQARTREMVKTKGAKTREMAMQVSRMVKIPPIPLKVRRSRTTIAVHARVSPCPKLVHRSHYSCFSLDLY